MAIYGKLICRTCKEEIFLGKWLRNKQEEGIGFWHGKLCKEGEADSHLLGKKALRFLAKHINHEIAIYTDDNKEYLEITEDYTFEQTEQIDDFWDDRAKE